MDHSPTPTPAPESADQAGATVPGAAAPDEARVLACVVCGDDSEFIAVASNAADDELMCSRCGQARLVTRLPAVHARRVA